MKSLLIGLAALAFTAAPAHAVVLYGVDEINNLVSFDSAAPGTTLSSVAISGVTGSSLLAIDFRPNTGLLYGLTDDYRLFQIDRYSGATSLVSTLALSGSNFAFDFNPTNNNLRIVSNNNTNYVYNFVTNALVNGVNVSYGSGVDPDIVAAGYLNNDRDPGTGTTLYVIDTRNDILATQNPATGALTQIGALGVDLGSRTSFDIFTSGASNTPFVQNGNSLYSINLGSGALSLIGNTDRALFALSAAPVPEPATWAMMLTGFGLVGASARTKARRRAHAI
jgi:hypothetical protein